MATYMVTTSTQVSTIVFAPEPAMAIVEAGYRFADLGVQFDPASVTTEWIHPIWRVHDRKKTLFLDSCEDRYEALEAFALTIHKPRSVEWQDLVEDYCVERAEQSEIWAALEEGKIAYCRMANNRRILVRNSTLLGLMT